MNDSKIDLIECSFPKKNKKKTIWLLNFFLRHRIWPERCQWTGSACTVTCALAGPTQTRWPVTSVLRVWRNDITWDNSPKRTLRIHSSYYFASPSLLLGNKSLLPGLPRKEKGSSRRSSSNSDVINFKGTVLNIPNLLQRLESSKAAQHEMEKRLADLQAMLGTASKRGLSFFARFSGGVDAVCVWEKPLALYFWEVSSCQKSFKKIC